MSWIGEFRDEHWRWLNDEHSSGAYNEPRHDELGERRRRGLDNGRDHNTNNACKQYFLPPNPIT